MRLSQLMLSAALILLTVSCAQNNKRSGYPREITAEEYEEIVKPLHAGKVQIPDDYVPTIPITSALRELVLSDVFYEEGYSIGLNDLNLFDVKPMSVEESARFSREYRLRGQKATSWYADTLLLVKAFYLEKKDDFYHYNFDYIHEHSKVGYEQGRKERMKRIDAQRSQYLK